jgi:predicted kinase
LKIHINPDHFLETDAGRVTTPERNKAAWKKCFEALGQALQDAHVHSKVYVMVGPQGAGKSTWVRDHMDEMPDAIVFDAILVKCSERKPIIDAVKIRRLEIFAVWMRTPLETCISRNASRPAGEVVMERAIRNVHAAIERPSLEEGFSEIIEVG